jgi:hypothetical protein
MGFSEEFIKSYKLNNLVQGKRSGLTPGQIPKVSATVKNQIEDSGLDINGILAFNDDGVIELSSDNNIRAAGRGTVSITGNSNKERFEVISTVAGAYNGIGIGGTIESPAATPVSRFLVYLSAGGHDGTDIVESAAFYARASQNFTPTAKGTSWYWETTAVGTTSRTIKMTLAHDGKLGIGTTAPTAPLDVNGQAVFGGNSTFNINQTYHTVVVGDRPAADGISVLLFNPTTDTAKGMGLGYVSSTDKLHIADWGTSGAPSRVTFTRAGQVGIGTSVPTNTLTVNGTITVTDVKGTYEAGVLGFSDSNWGFLYRPPRAGANGAHLFENFAGTDLVVFKEDGNVGIGTNAPTTPLDVNGDQFAGGTLALRGGDNLTFGGDSRQIDFYWNGSTDYGHNIKSRHYDTAQAGNALDFYLWQYGVDAAGDPGSLHIMTLENGGVGIGTSTPLTPLHIQDGSISVDAGDIFALGQTVLIEQANAGINLASNAAGTYGSRLDFSEHSGAGVHANTWSWSRETTGSGGNFECRYGSNVDSSSNTLKLAITTSGRLGIGTAAPANTLTVVNDISTEGYSIVPTYKGLRYSGTQSAPLATGSSNTLISMEGWVYDGTSTALSSRIAVVSTQAATPTARGSDLRFSTTQNGSTSLVERMRIAHTGDVGIGTTSPGHKLHVYDLTATVSAQIETGLSGGDSALRLKAGGATTGGAHLKLVGDTTYADYGFKVARLGAGISDLRHRGTSALQIVTHEAAPINFHTSSTFAATIDSSGQIGIGTSAPTTPLDVDGDLLSGGTLRLRGGDTTAFPPDSRQIDFSFNGGTLYGHNIRTRHDNAAQTNNAIHFYLWQQGVDAAEDPGSLHAMTLANGGYIGLGTDAPSADLHIKRTGDASIWLEADTDNVTETDNAWIKMTQDNQAVDLMLGLTGDVGKDPENVAYTGTIANSLFLGGRYSASALQFGLNGAVRITIDAAGKVGIGTNAPGQELHVVGSGGVLRLEGSTHVFQEFYPQGSTTRYGWLGYGTPSNSTMHVYNEQNADLVFGTNNLARMTIDAAGRVGIGDSTPSYKLDVNGAVRATELLHANKGIVFPATQVSSADANTLDDYEEGTWTPEFRDAAGNILASHTIQKGSYVKIGRGVYLWGRITAGSSLSPMVGTNGVRIWGLPFAEGSGNGVYGSFRVGTVGSLALPIAGPSITGYVAGSGTSVTLRITDSTAGVSDLSVNELSGSADIIFSCNYMAA